MPARAERGVTARAWLWASLVLVVAGCHQVTGISPNPAPPGMIVTITGTGFGAAPATGDQVLYDGASIEVISWADTAIQARIPRKPDGAYSVQVTHLGTTSPALSHSIVTGTTLQLYNVRTIRDVNMWLRTILEFDTNIPASAAAIVTRTDKTWSVPSAGILTDSPGVHHRVAVLGMRPGVTHQLTAMVSTATAQTWQSVLYQPDPLPPSFPAVHRLHSQPSAQQPGYTVFPIHQGVVTLEAFIYVLDEEGYVVWFARPGLNVKLDDVEYMSNGDVLYLAQGDLTEIDMLGNVIHHYTKYDIGVPAMHHMVTELPNGNLLTLVPDMRVIGGYPGDQTYKVVADGVAEFTRDGHLVRSQQFWDWLDPYRIPDWDAFFTPVWGYLYGSDAYTFTGANGVVYDASDDSLIVSMRSQDMVVKVDRTTGALKWVLGEDLPTSTGDDAWPYLHMVGPGLFPKHQHAPMLLPSGNVMVYDNGNNRLPSASRPVEYAIDASHMEVREEWAWIDPDYNPSLFSYFTGDADLLPNGNVLVADPGLFDFPGYPIGQRWIRLAEVRKSDKQKLWEVSVHDAVGGNGFTGYNAKRFTSLYPPGRLADPAAPH